MNDIFMIAGIAIISSGLAVLLKQYKPEYAFGVILLAGIFILFYLVGFLKEILSTVKDFVSLSGINGKNFEILLKCAGVCIIAKTASEICNDCGQTAVSSKIELAGKAIILICALPLFSETVEIIKMFLSL